MSMQPNMADELERARRSIAQLRSACKANNERAELAEKRAADAEHQLWALTGWLDSLIINAQDVRERL